MAQIARTGGEKAPATAKDTTKSKSPSCAGARLRPQATSPRTEDQAQTGPEHGRCGGRGGARAAAGTTKLGRGFVGVANEQARHNLETLKALSGTVDWPRFAKVVDWNRVFQL